MSDNFICKECSYTSEESGVCPHCEVPLESLTETGESKSYGGASYGFNNGMDEFDDM